jgi:hypothetical protein
MKAQVKRQAKAIADSKIDVNTITYLQSGAAILYLIYMESPQLDGQSISTYYEMHRRSRLIRTLYEMNIWFDDELLVARIVLHSRQILLLIAGKGGITWVGVLILRGREGG